MIDPASFGTAVTVLGVITTMVVAFGLAVLSDMALRRREDRAARESAGIGSPGSGARRSGER